VKTLGYVGFNDALGEAFFAEIDKAAAARKIPLTGNERFAPKDTSVTGQALKLVAAKPDAIVIGASGTPAALPARALIEQGYKGRLYFNHGVANNDFLRVGGIGDGARDHDAIAHRIDIETGAGHELAQRVAHAGGVAAHFDVVSGDLTAVAVEENHAGLADGDADEISAARRTHHGVGDRGVGDQHVLGVSGKIDHRRLADADGEKLAVAYAAARIIAGLGGADADGRQRGGNDQDKCNRGPESNRIRVQTKHPKTPAFALYFKT